MSLATLCRDVLIYLLHCVGARRCGKDVQGCREGCGAGYSFDGSPKGVTSPSVENHAKHVQCEYPGYISSSP